MTNPLQVIQKLFGAERVPLTTGGFLVHGVTSNDFAQTPSRLINLLTGSRGLNRLPQRASGDIRWLMDTIGYDKAFAEQMVFNEYQLFQQEVIMQAMLIALLNDNFMVSHAEGGLSVAFKPEVNAPELTIPDGYWTNDDLNERRSLEGLIRLPDKNPKNPAEQKFALIHALMEHERATHEPNVVYVYKETAPIFNQANEQLSTVSFGDKIKVLGQERVKGAAVYKLDADTYIATEHVVVSAFDRIIANQMLLFSKAGAFQGGGESAPKAVSSFQGTHGNGAQRRPRKRGKRGGAGKK